ncbi:hypothetical protein IPP75_02370 [Candidatus Saccharibacteria bacterium]|nr:MAG: hypothetical protein IPP75_02370 [Candidatus Saccharibacteria bacterium]
MLEFNRTKRTIATGLLVATGGLGLSACGGQKDPNAIGACPKGWASTAYEVPSGEMPDALAAIYVGQHALAASVPQEAMFGYESSADGVYLGAIPNGPQEETLRTVFSDEGRITSVFLRSPMVGTPATTFCTDSSGGHEGTYLSPAAVNSIIAMRGAGIVVNIPGK